MVPVENMRDHFLSFEYANLKSVKTKRDTFEFCNGLHMVFRNVWQHEGRFAPEFSHLKEAIRKKFHPVM